MRIAGLSSLALLLLFAGHSFVQAADLVEVRPVDLAIPTTEIAVDISSVPITVSGGQGADCGLVIYDNTTDQGYVYSPGTSNELIDYGTSDGGTVCSFRFGYATTMPEPSAIAIRFYSGTSGSVCPGTYLDGYILSDPPGSSDGSWAGWTITVDLTGMEFDLPAGAFGYSYEFGDPNTSAILATGGSGNEDRAYYEGCSPFWFGGPPDPWAGFYMQVNTFLSEHCYAPPDYDYTITPESEWQTTGADYFDAGGCRVYRMNLSASVSYDFSTCVDDGVGGSCDADSDFMMFDSTGGYLWDIDGDPSCGWAASTLAPDQGSWSPPSDGYYYLRVSEYFSEAITYDMAYRGLSGQTGSEIRGAKWNDLNEDGRWDHPDESGLAGWEIYLDADDDAQWDPCEVKVLTDQDGNYVFSGLAPGSYIVAEVQQPGWQQTCPPGGGSVPMAVGDQAAGRSTYADAMTIEELDKLEIMAMDSGPKRPVTDGVDSMAVDIIPQSAFMLSDVPTTTWTYGCSATSAGMIFGYYDRTGYPNMYAGPTNGGVAPITNLGQGIGAPIPGSCSIIATQNGFDGRAIRGHVDDYWISTNSNGPDPWEGSWAEHARGDCTADYMGTNQWKWDFYPWPDGDGTRDTNIDGSTILVWNTDGSKLYDFVPPASTGLPQTALCHGMRLFAESRGYTVVENYTQLIDARVTSGGFTFANYMAEIDAGYPVMVQVEGHSMVGIGYEVAAMNTVYLHDTWDNSVHPMVWGMEYSGMQHRAMTVIHLEAIVEDGRHRVTLEQGGLVENINFGNYPAGLGCSDWCYYDADVDLDCYVGFSDFVQFVGDWMEAGLPHGDDNSDINGDMQVDISDYGMFSGQWLKCTDPHGVGCDNLCP